MSTKEISNCIDLKTSSMLKPVSELSKLTLTEQIKATETVEYCKIAEAYLKDLEKEFQFLSTVIHENLKLKDDYLVRNKINLVNTESLIQARNELYKYKCELKSDYSTTGEALKTKRQKYKKIISDYESEWLKTLEQYEANPLVVEYYKIQQENKDLEKELEEIEKLAVSSENQFKIFKQTVEKNFIQKIVEFSREMIYYETCAEFQKQKKEKKALLEKLNKSLNNNKFKIFSNNSSILELKNAIDIPNVEPMIDVSHFDNISIPTEHLEEHNEDELLGFYPDDIKSTTNENRQSLNSNLEISSSESLVNTKKIQDKQICDSNTESVGFIENESQYFVSNSSKNVTQEKTDQNDQNYDNWRHRDEKLVLIRNDGKEIDENYEKETKKLKLSSYDSRNEKEFFDVKQDSKEMNRSDAEENLSDRNFENQFGNTTKIPENVQNESRNSYFSDEALTPLLNNSLKDEYKSPPQGLSDDQYTNDSVPNYTETNSYKTFGGFFLDNAQKSTKPPSFFNLF